ncbi:MAG: tRNA (adenosine(37)-N6)-threonylcarbamoyltransferase complex dimerization subunit type 1 TsaB [Fidelibacterota bacterium]|nr:MAG: tRNA (adenosine(37)-N6)-threonylcarbamoyltransferase complex dimerization subunit type 1 TsaB [Candidatus Neomarinimicrobiota bacterium]
MKLLAIETAYDVCGVAVVSEAGVVALEEQLAPRSHSEVLAPSVERLLNTADYRFSDLEGIAISVGPGSYTGLRVGMSYAKGVAFGTGLPVIPVPTLPSLLEGEEIEPPDWVAAWSHGRNVYAMQRQEKGGWNEVQFMGWDDFSTQVRGLTVAGYLLDRLQPASDMMIAQTCPSAVKVGKFALRMRLTPAADLAALVPDYHQEYQIRLATHADS